MKLNEVMVVSDQQEFKMEYLTLFLYSWFISGCLSSLFFIVCCIYVDCRFELEEFIVSVLLVIFGYVSIILTIVSLYESIEERNK